MTFRLAAVTLSSALIACTPTDGGDTDGGTDSGGSTSDTTADATSDGSATSAATTSSSSSPTTSDGGTTGATADATTGGADVPTFTTDVWPIFMVSCSCHTQMTPGPPTGLDMGSDPAGAYAAIVNAPSSIPGLDEVEPGASDMSYLYHKLAGTQGSVGGAGTQMPPGGMLGASDLATVQAWIDGGAPE